VALRSTEDENDMASNSSGPDRWKPPAAMVAAMAVGGLVYSLLPPGPVALRAVATGIVTAVACLLLLAGLSRWPRTRP
jgi:protein-S-isoprenylcysteine O-methyltransferase Ste14